MRNAGPWLLFTLWCILAVSTSTDVAVVSQGDPSDGLWLLVSGKMGLKMRVTAEEAMDITAVDPVITVRRLTLQPGTIFGEVGPTLCECAIKVTVFTV